MMKKYFLSALMTVISMTIHAQATDNRTQVLIETSMGNIKIALYNETPKHRDNFIKLVKEGFYNGILFHRVIPEFMVQAGDPTSKRAKPGELLGGGDLDYTVPSEVVFPKYYHKHGALAAAQDENAVNNASSACQFYIVTGKTFGPRMLDKMLTELTEKSGGKIQFTDEIKNDYKTIGGAPHLDGQYTVFGEVTEGMDVVDLIQNAEKDQNDRPLQDIKIIKAHILSTAK